VVDVHVHPEDQSEETTMPSKVPSKPNQKKAGKTLKEKRAAKQEKKGK
jgi:hypothetical protein